MSQDTCPYCEKASLVRGTLESTGAIRFRPLETKFLTFRTADIDVHASMCSSCGWVGLTGDTEKLNQLKNIHGRHAGVPSATSQA